MIDVTGQGHNSPGSEGARTGGNDAAKSGALNHRWGVARFGVFLRLDGLPEAMALAEITAIPKDASLPALGARITGTVISHAHHNHQVRIKLTEWAE